MHISIEAFLFCFLQVRCQTRAMALWWRIMEAPVHLPQKHYLLNPERGAHKEALYKARPLWVKSLDILIKGRAFTPNNFTKFYFAVKLRI